MKMDHIYKLIKEKYDITEATIDGDESDFIIRTNDGQTYTNSDFTKSELDKAKADLESERARLEAEALAAKASAKAKLEALGLTLDDLAALGL
jgi:hypothetical protein